MKIRQVTVKLSKKEAWQLQTEAAIDALKSGAIEVAITLAGAAEGLIEGRSELFSLQLKAMVEMNPSIEEKTWIMHMNNNRDWLKHSSTRSRSILEINTMDGAHMILRAMAKGDEWTPKMMRFKDWFFAEIEKQNPEA